MPICSVDNMSCSQHCPLTKELVQIRYNTYDRSPMDRWTKQPSNTALIFSVASELLSQFYTALTALETELGNPQNQVSDSDSE